MTDGQGTVDRPQRRLDVVCRQVGDELLLYDPGSDSVHTLNHSAAAIWDLCDGSRTTTEVVQALRTRYAPPARDELAQDVEAVLLVLGGAGLLSRTAGAGRDG